MLAPVSLIEPWSLSQEERIQMVKVIGTTPIPGVAGVHLQAMYACLVLQDFTGIYGSKEARVFLHAILETNFLGGKSLLSKQNVQATPLPPLQNKIMAA